MRQYQSSQFQRPIRTTAANVQKKETHLPKAASYSYSMMSEDGTTDAGNGEAHIEGFNRVHALKWPGGESAHSWKEIDIVMTAHRRTSCLTYQCTHCLSLNEEEKATRIPTYIRGTTDLTELSNTVAKASRDKSVTAELVSVLEGTPCRGQKSNYPILVGIGFNWQGMDYWTQAPRVHALKKDNPRATPTRASYSSTSCSFRTIESSDVSRTTIEAYSSKSKYG